MSPGESFYPAAPAGIPADLTLPTGRYRFMVILVLLSLLLFVIIYLALVAASGYLAYWAFVLPPPQSSRGGEQRWWLVLKIGAIAISLMLFLFFLKGLFKYQKSDTSHYFPIKEAEHPRLFAFIRQLCRDTKAPFPRRIYVSAEVNAAVFYDSSLLSLIVPVRKNLLIGLGLVNVLTLDEFKAVLAHEFGHFSQSSMKLGTYVYTCNRIITDMVYGRDAWDHFLNEWKRIDIRLAVFGWGLWLVVTALRYVLAGIFRVINLGNLALSRQMEFNADLVAVSVTGSDALVHSLAKLDFANQALGHAVHDLQTASDHQLYSRDLFFHQTHAAVFLRHVQKNASLGLPPELPGDPRVRNQVFQPGEGGVPIMWSTHPSNHDREENAKRHYCRSVLDTRSPWLLFDEADALRAKVTLQVYHTWCPPEQKLSLAPPETVQTFIDEERAETTYDPKYHDVYNDRYLEPGDVGELVKQPAPAGEQLARDRACLYDAQLAEWMKNYKLRRTDFDFLVALKLGQNKPQTTFTFRGQEYKSRDVERLYNEVDQELAADRMHLAELDRRVFLLHYQLARLVDADLAGDLLNRYRFHLGVQVFLKNLMDHQYRVQGLLQYVSSGRELSPEDFRGVVQGFAEARQVLEDGLTAADTLFFPKLKNFEAGQVLRPFLLDEPLVRSLAPTDPSLEGQWINGLLKQMGLVLDRLRRIHFKSLGGILALQERIGKTWEEKENPQAPDRGDKLPACP